MEISQIDHRWRRLFELDQSVLARNTLVMLSGQGISFVLQAVYFVILARMMGPTEYGIMAGAFAFTSLAAQYGSLGAGTIFIRYVSGQQDRFPIYWGNVLLSTLACGSTLSFALYALARSVLNLQSAEIVLLAGIANCIFAQLASESSRVFQAFEMMRMTALLSLMSNSLRFVAVGVMFLFCHHANARQWTAVSLIVSAIACAVAVVVVSAKLGTPKFSIRLSVAHAAEGLGFAFAMSTSTVYNDLDKTMLSHYGMNLANGLYSLAYRVVDIASIPLFSLREAVLPRLFRVGRTGIEGCAGLSMRLLKGALPAGLFAALLLFLVAPLIPMILGPAFSESAFALRCLCLIPVFRSVHQMTGGALTGAGYQTVRTAAQCSAAAVNLLLNLWLIPGHGWRGAAWASLVTDGLLAVACWELLRFIRKRAFSIKKGVV